jgi:hypothetical protein
LSGGSGQAREGQGSKDVQISIDPRSCLATITVQQVTSFEGGTGLFTGATGTGTGAADALAMAQRGPDGSCSQDLLPAHEIDTVSGTGNLTF